MQRVDQVSLAKTVVRMIRNEKRENLTDVNISLTVIQATILQLSLYEVEFRENGA